MNNALLIVDVQNFFINKWTQQVPLNIVALIKDKNFQVIAFTKFVNTPDSNFVKQLNYTACAKPPYTEIVNDLKPWVKKDNVFVKNTYSGFIKPDLQNFLEKNKVDEITVVGIDSENCLLTNARELFDRGYKVTVVENCCGSATGGPEMHQTAMEIIKNNIGKVI